MYKVKGSDGKDYGPVDEAQVRLWLKEGRIDKSSLACDESEQWKPLHQYPEFSDGALPAVSIPKSFEPPPPNYLIFAVLITVFCCPPCGVMGIIYSTQANTKYALGDLAGARAAAKKAGLWCWISLMACLIFQLISFFMASTFLTQISQLTGPISTYMK